MNIFYVHKDPVVSAKMLIDKHVVKMIIESAQMLSTAHRLLDGEQYEDKTKAGRRIKRWRLSNKVNEDIIYKASHMKHPSTVWVMDNVLHYNWLYKHMIALNDEYKKRYNHTKNHVTIDKLGDILKHPPKNAKYNKMATDPKPAMPEHCKVPGDSVASYRKYYILEKRRFATWKSPAKMPDWYKKGVDNDNRV